MKNFKELYEIPIVEIVELKLEGVIAASTDENEGVTWGGSY